jgi:hypothetical protein
MRLHPEARYGRLRQEPDSLPVWEVARLMHGNNKKISAIAREIQAWR